MPSFSYKAMNDSGKHVNGVLTAENYQVALRQHQEQALFPINVKEGVEESGVGFVQGQSHSTSSCEVHAGEGRVVDQSQRFTPLTSEAGVVGDVRCSEEIDRLRH